MRKSDLLRYYASKIIIFVNCFLEIFRRHTTSSNCFVRSSRGGGAYHFENLHLQYLIANWIKYPGFPTTTATTPSTRLSTHRRILLKPTLPSTLLLFSPLSALQWQFEFDFLFFFISSVSIECNWTSHSPLLSLYHYVCWLLVDSIHFLRIYIFTGGHLMFVTFYFKYLTKIRAFWNRNNLQCYLKAT